MIPVLILGNACRGPEAGPDPQVDATGRATAPRRIVSLIPAATEILFALGAGDRVVGRTRWGGHPPAARHIPDVGDGIRPSLEAVVAREPDLVILYDGDTNRESRERLGRLGVPTLALRHDTLEDLSSNIRRSSARRPGRAGAFRRRRGDERPAAGPNLL